MEATEGDTALSKVAAMVEVPPSGAREGRTLQVVLAGTPEQLMATFPERPVSEVSSKG